MQLLINGQNVTNFASYPNAILNITGSGEIALYENISTMQNNTASEGSLALVYNTTNLQGLFQYTNNSWEIAPTGLTAINEYVDSEIFWGSNGVEQGTLQVNTNLTKDQVKIKAQVYNDLSYLELDDSVTSLSEIYNGYSNIEAVPSIMGNSVTECFRMFQNCFNLSSVGNMFFPNCTNFRAMFAKCYNLSSIPVDSRFWVSNGTYNYMYEDCGNISTVINNISINNSVAPSAFYNSRYYRY